MFFVLSKTIAFLFLPSNFLILLGLAGIGMLAARRIRAGTRMTAACVALIAVAGFLPIGDWLTRPLENRFPAWDANRGAPDGIVVLGGGVATSLSVAYGSPVLDESGARILAMATLARTYPDARIVYTGGDASLFGNEAPETDFVYPLLDSLGIPRSRVVLETRSRNTAENAVYTKGMVKPKPGERWLLVTSAQHMPRAIGCFRQAGFPVEAYPVGWQAKPTLDLIPNKALAKGLARLDAASHEWLGLVIYRMTGKTSELFPSP